LEARIKARASGEEVSVKSMNSAGP